MKVPAERGAAHGRLCELGLEVGHQLGERTLGLLVEKPQGVVHVDGTVASGEPLVLSRLRQEPLKPFLAIILDPSKQGAPADRLAHLVVTIRRGPADIFVGPLPYEAPFSLPRERFVEQR